MVTTPHTWPFKTTRVIQGFPHEHPKMGMHVGCNERKLAIDCSWIKIKSGEIHCSPGKYASILNISSAKFSCLLRDSKQQQQQPGITLALAAPYLLPESRFNSLRLLDFTKAKIAVKTSLNEMKKFGFVLF